MTSWRLLRNVLAIVCATSSFALAQQAPAGKPLRIEVSETGRTVFEGLISDIAQRGWMPAPPQVSYTSSLAALRDFCQRPNGEGPDIVLSAARLRPSLAADCAKNGIPDVAAVELGRGALILAVRKGSKLTELNRHQVYLALARDVPDKDEFRRNLAVRWSDIDRTLPATDIRFQLPTRDDGTRAMFEDLVMQGGCRQEKLVEQIFSAQHRTARCVTTRVDRVRDIPRAQAVQALLDAPEGTVGVLTYIDILQSGGELVPLVLDGVRPTRDNILNGAYEFSSSIWLYTRQEQAPNGDTAGTGSTLARIIERAQSDAVAGPDGVLARLGLVPLSEEEREEQRVALTAGSQPYDFMAMMGSAASAAMSAVSAVWGAMGLSPAEADARDKGTAPDLTMLMDIAGYKIKQFDSRFGIIPGAGMTFGLVREMSEADEEYLERQLYHDAHRRQGILSAIQRRILRTILDVNDSGGYQVSDVEITFLPLPEVRLVVSPSDGAMSQEATLLMRGIERLGDRLTEGGR